MLSRFVIKSLFIVDKHILMNRMSEEKAIASLLHIDEELVKAMMKEKGGDYDIILDDLVTDEDLASILKGQTIIDPHVFVNYKYFYLTNDRIKEVVERYKIQLNENLSKDLKDNKLVSEYNNELEFDRKMQLYENRNMLEMKLVDLENFIQFLFPNE